MKAMILAAGRGERMRPLTDTVPKPLLPLAGRPLLDHLLSGLARGGFHEVVINHSHLGEQIVAHVGDGSRFGLRVKYSHEAGGGLETGGGIVRALPLLDSEVFAVINGDIWTDYGFANLPRSLDSLAHLVLVANPPHHPSGDFVLDEEAGGKVRADTGGDATRLTFSGIGVYRRELFRDCAPGKFPLAPLLRDAMRRGAVTGERFTGRWHDVGTPARLDELDRVLQTGRTG